MSYQNTTTSNCSNVGSCKLNVEVRALRNDGKWDYERFAKLDPDLEQKQKRWMSAQGFDAKQDAASLIERFILAFDNQYDEDEPSYRQDRLLLAEPILCEIIKEAHERYRKVYKSTNAAFARRVAKTEAIRRILTCHE